MAAKKVSRRSRSEQVARRAIASVASYQKVFGSVDGQKVLTDLMNTHHMFRSNMFSGASSEEMAFRDGERSVVLRILDRLHKNPNELRKHLEETLNGNSKRASSSDIVW